MGLTREPPAWTALGLAAALRGGEVAAVEVARDMLARLDSLPYSTAHDGLTIEL